MDLDNWNRFNDFLKRHDEDLRQKKVGQLDKIYNDFINEFDVELIKSKNSLKVFLSFYRRFCKAKRIYQKNQHYKPSPKY
jgi:hypothetical protein